MAGDPSWASVSLLLHGDGFTGSTTAQDKSPTTKTVTFNGNAQVSTAQSKFGGASFLFDGNGDFLSATHADFPLAASDFTVEGWLYAPSTITTTQMLAGSWDGSSTLSWNLFIGNQDQIGLEFTTTGAYTSVVSMISANNAVPTGSWVHFAVTRSGSTFRLFVNGSQVATNTSSATVYNPGNTIKVGGNTNNQWLNGHLDEFRITKGVARYTANFTAPTAAFPDGLGEVSGTVLGSTGAAAIRFVRAYRRDSGALSFERYTNAGEATFNNNVLLLHLDGADNAVTTTDNSLLAKAITFLGNAKLSTAQKKYGISSLNLDGSSSYIRAAQSADFQLFNVDSTIELWVRYSTTSGNQCIWQADSAGSGTNRASLSLLDGDLKFYTEASGSSGNRISTAAPAVDTWHHLALARSGSTFTLYVNGVDSGTTTTTVLPTGNLFFSVGSTANISGGVQHFTGHIDEIRVTKGVARYTANFTPPTDRFPDRTSGAIGTYSFYTPTLDELTVMALDDATSGTIYNDIVHRVIPA